MIWAVFANLKLTKEGVPRVVTNSLKALGAGFSAGSQNRLCGLVTQGLAYVSRVGRLGDFRDGLLDLVSASFPLSR